MPPIILEVQSILIITTSGVNRESMNLTGDVNPISLGVIFFDYEPMVNAVNWLSTKVEIVEDQ